MKLTSVYKPDDLDAYIQGAIRRKEAPFIDDFINPGMAAAFLSNAFNVRIDPASVGRALGRIGSAKMVAFKAKHVTRFKYSDDELSLPKVQYKNINLYVVRNMSIHFPPSRGGKPDLAAIRERFQVERTVVLGTPALKLKPPPMPDWEALANDDDPNAPL